MIPRVIAAVFSLLAAFASGHPALALTSDCLAMARLPGFQLAQYSPAPVAENDVRLTYVGHSTFIIESHGGVRIATDYSGNAGGIVPDVVTMNHAHRSHYTDYPDPAIKHVLRGWNPEGGAVHHDVQVSDVHIRNVTTDIRGSGGTRIPDGNSIFIFEIAGLCIGHLGHLHHELTPAHIAQIGRLDVVLVPVDGGYTMAQINMLQVLKDLKARVVIPMHFFGPATLARFLAQVRPDFAFEWRGDASVVLSAARLPEKPTVMVLSGY